MPSIDTQKLLTGLKAYAATGAIEALIEKFKAAGIVDKVAVAFGIIKEAVHLVEKLATDLEGLGTPTGQEKRDAVVSFLDDVVKLPFFLEPIDGPLIGQAVDGLVAWYNFKIGHGWLDKIRPFI